MKVTISQRYVYHKVGTIEIEINKKDYEKYLIDNKGYHSLDDYLLEHEELWSEQIDNATYESELEFGSGCYENGFNEESSDAETRYDCKETHDGGHL
jgi:hypothetical protein